jgi:hypothetical protein
MSLKIIHKNSTNAGTPPAGGDIDVGEIAINAADAALYVKDTNGNIKNPANSATFTQSGSGAVQRTVDSKLKDTVSVKDFGAVGNGTFDCTSAFQAAVNHSGLTGDAIYVPPGEYVIGSVTCGNNVTIYGDGPNASVLKCKANTNATMLDAASSSKVQITGLRFDYNPTQNNGAPAPGASQSGVAIRHFCNVSNCEFIGTVGAGIIGYGSDNTISDNYFGNGPYSVQPNSICVQLLVGAGTIACSRNRILSNIADNIANGFSVKNTGALGTNNQFVGNRVSNTTTTFLPSAVAGAINAWRCKDTLIADNFAFNCSSAGIRLIDGSENSIVRNNIVINCGLLGAIGIDIGDSTLYLDRNLVIANNIAVGCGGPGFWLTSVYNSVISGNVSNNNGTVAIPPPEWNTDFYQAGFVIASEADSAATPVANNVFSANSCRGNRYAISRTGNLPGVVVSNLHIGNNYDGNSVSSYNYSPSTDLYLSNLTTAIDYIYDYSRNYGVGDGAVFARSQNSATGRALLLGFDNNFATTPGAVVQSTGSIGLAAGSGDGLSGNRRLIVKDSGAVRYVPRATPPTSPETGDTYYDSVLDKLRCWNGLAWNDLF